MYFILKKSVQFGVLVKFLNDLEFVSTNKNFQNNSVYQFLSQHGLNLKHLMFHRILLIKCEILQKSNYLFQLTVILNSC